MTSLDDLIKCKRKSCKKELKVSTEYNKQVLLNPKKTKNNPIYAKENVDLLTCSVNKCNKQQINFTNSMNKFMCVTSNPKNIKKAKFDCKPIKQITVKKAQKNAEDLIKLAELNKQSRDKKKSLTK